MSAGTDVLWVFVARSVPRYMETFMPAAVLAKYDFVCFGKGAAEGALLDLTVTGAQPVAAVHQQTTEVGHEHFQCTNFTFWAGCC